MDGPTPREYAFAGAALLLIALNLAREGAVDTPTPFVWRAPGFPLGNLYFAYWHARGALHARVAAGSSPKTRRRGPADACPLARYKQRPAAKVRTRDARRPFARPRLPRPELLRSHLGIRAVAPDPADHGERDARHCARAFGRARGSAAARGHGGSSAVRLVHPRAPRRLWRGAARLLLRPGAARPEDTAPRDRNRWPPRRLRQPALRCDGGRPLESGARARPVQRLDPSNGAASRQTGCFCRRSTS